MTKRTPTLALALLVCLVHPCRAAGPAKNCAQSNGQCHTGEAMAASSILQRAVKRTHLSTAAMSGMRSQAEDARFLMQATFGPTRQSLQAISDITYTEWIQEQIALPTELHRAAYRSQVNPRDIGKPQSVAKPASPCSGGRFRDYVFTFEDVGKHLLVNGTASILVEGRVRSELKPHPLATTWVAKTGWAGYICTVYEGVGSDVIISERQDCHWNYRQALPNPAIWVPGEAVELPGPAFRVKSGVVVVYAGPSCALQKPADGSELFVKLDGVYYTYEQRYHLQGNTPDQPIAQVGSCVGRNRVNEASCKLGPLSTGNITHGLLAEMHNAAQGGKYIYEMTGSERLAMFVDPVIYHGYGSGDWAAFPVAYTHNFAVHWSGTLTVNATGNYTFYLGSDDGSQLKLDGQVVIDNGGWHGWVEKSASIILNGSHAIEIDMFQGSGGRAIGLSWSGPDSGGVKVLVPSSALTTPGQGFALGACPVSCGSPGEVASNPTLGHQLPMYLTSDGNDLDNDFDNRYANRLPTSLAKSTVWTMKTLQAPDQLRQRMAWALSQIWVVSVQGIGDDHQSEMWINFYDIFVRHAMGNFRNILQEVTFSPIMGRYLTHTGSSSFDYNGNMPNENYAREIMQLFTIGLDLMNPDGTTKVDANGVDMPSYTNDNILTFSRVFTGFTRQGFRGNVEYLRSSDNYFDSMQGCDLYQEYRDIRTDLLLEPSELSPITSTGQDCTNFGIHSRLSFLKELYDRQEAAFITNVGNLVEPTTMQTFRSGEAERCFNLFSHSDQQNGAQTLKCQELGTTAHGAGGRMADALAMGAHQYRTTSFSLAGSAVWPTGEITRREVVDDRGSTTFHEYEEWIGAIGNISAQRHGNVYADAYADNFLKSIELTQTLGRTLDEATLQTNYDTNTGLQRQLYQVAKLIAARDGRQAQRDFFFVSIGGWDMHSNMKASLTNGFGMVDDALRGFVAEMQAQGIWDRVLLTSSSEFARTLDSNGGGSDHAWAGQQFVMSGSINGGRIYNRFPASLQAGNDHDLGRGRLIPDYPWESLMKPVADWLGVAASQYDETFPNLKFFNSSHTIPFTELFKP